MNNLILTTIRKPEITTPFSEYSIDTHHLIKIDIIENILGLKYNPFMFINYSQEDVKRTKFTTWLIPIDELPNLHKTVRLDFFELKNKVLADQLDDYTLNLYMDLVLDLLGAIKSQLFYNPEHSQYRDFWIRELAPDINKLHNMYKDFFKEHDKKSHLYLYEVLDAALSYLSITELDADLPPTYQLLQELDDHDQGDIFDAYIDTRDFNNILSDPQIYCNLK